jgi:hypothetical protein
VRGVRREGRRKNEAKKGKTGFEASGAPGGCGGAERGDTFIRIHLKVRLYMCSWKIWTVSASERGYVAAYEKEERGEEKREKREERREKEELEKQRI